METALIIGYVACMVVVLTYCVSQLTLAWHYWKARKRDANVSRDATHQPHVTVQLPVYNELYVVERLIDAVCALDYPKELLEVQLLDDGNDESVEVAAAKVKHYQSLGFDIAHIRRADRSGYKAGALKYGLAIAKGEFIAIFDADFIPAKDFLRQTIPAFTSDDIGMVQTRWDHLNKDYSLMTKLMAFGLDFHFSVEQRGRNSGGFFMNFSGTAGVWRKACIEDAGNWHADTLTEDLDLSYRAQLKGWKFRYLEDVRSPAELPVAMSAMKTQQFRWNKGGAETARKLIGQVLKHKLPIRVKWHAIAHLFNSSIYIFILLSAVMSVPILAIVNEQLHFRRFYQYASIFMLATLSVIIVYSVAVAHNDMIEKRRRFRYWLFLAPFLSISLGLSLHNGLAVLKGYFGKRSAFVRTPKFNVTGQKGGWKSNKYLGTGLGIVTWLEGLFALYFLGGMSLAVYYGDYALFPFHLMAAIGFAVIFYYSLRQAASRRVA